MRRCYRGVALVVGAVLFASNTFSNSCSLNVTGVYAAEATSEEKQVKATSISDQLTNESLSELIVSTVETAESTASIQTGEENVETEIPAENSVSEPQTVAEEKDKTLTLEYNDYNVLLKIVEAEAGGEDLTGKMLVANVILNRVNSDRFPNTVTEVVYQKSNGSAQFSPTVDGRIDTVSISQETLTAVERVLNGEDYSNGALYFRSVRCNSTWFDTSLTRVVEHGNHIFYKY